MITMTVILFLPHALRLFLWGGDVDDEDDLDMEDAPLDRSTTTSVDRCLLSSHSRVLQRICCNSISVAMNGDFRHQAA